jgi:hypothetical protein
MTMKRAVLRVTGRPRSLTAQVRAGRKGTGRVLGTCQVQGAVWSDPLFRLAEQVAKQHDVRVLVETFTFPGGYDNCVVAPTTPEGGVVHLPNRCF